MKRYYLWIDGQGVAPHSGEWLISLAPGSAEQVCEIPAGTSPDIDHAVTAAHDAFGSWRELRPSERAAHLKALWKEVLDSADELAQLESWESGKPLWQAKLEIEAAAAYFDYYAGLINVPSGEVIDVGPGVHGFTRREPYGVVGVITPWNSPLNQAVRSLAPAIAAGNVVVVKPSEFTSATTLELGQIAAVAGLPPGIINVVTGTGSIAGAALVEHPQVRKLSFTGSVRAGREIGKVAAERIVPMTLELGGKSPHIVFADADLDAVAKGVVESFTFNAGQVCSAGTRLLVEQSVHDDVVAALSAAVAEVEPGVAYGPVTTDAQYAKVKEYFDIAQADGAKLMTGGRTLPGSWLVEPTIYSGVTPDMRIAREEIFGPVLSVLSVADEDEAVQIANDTEYGLVAGIWTADVPRALRVAKRLEVGQVYINEWLSRFMEAPFGGYKGSGYGREKGLEALHHYTQVKFIAVKL